ncbi:MAG: hypothetical protein OHK93_007095 [Ramalina farinacea]|uniref:Uncharacterized protein n=1 Tax=Ramalina farinacea TaxID=258253 RepID=A0AA43QL56_9LECA|nr:hypothetical protein [Ramalina farinacea]
MGRSKEPLTPFLIVILAIFVIVALIVLMSVLYALNAMYLEFKKWQASRRPHTAHAVWLSPHANVGDSTDSPPSRHSSSSLATWAGAEFPMDRLSRDEVPDDLLPGLCYPLPAAHVRPR